MLKRIAFMIAMALAVTACSAIGRLTVKNYVADSGERVMAGQAEPEGGYNCRKIVQEEQDWGLTGNMNKAAAMERITEVAVNTAPEKDANYAFIMAPAETSIMGFNVNAFSDAEVAYYRCADLPEAGE